MDNNKAIEQLKEGVELDTVIDDLLTVESISKEYNLHILQGKHEKAAELLKDKGYPVSIENGLLVVDPESYEDAKSALRKAGFEYETGV